MSTIGEKLTELRLRSGRTLQAVADIADYRGRSSVQKFFKPDYDPPYLDMNVAGRLARALVGQGNPPIEDDEIFSLTGSRTNDVSRYQHSEVAGLKKDVPIYLCPFFKKMDVFIEEKPLEVYVVERDNPVGYAWHPPAMTDRQKIYGLRVERLPLLPRYRPGEFVFVDPQAPVRFGDDILIMFDQHETSLQGLPSENAYAVFGTLTHQAGTTLSVRTMAGDRMFDVDSAGGVELSKLVSLHDAIVS